MKKLKTLSTVVFLLIAVFAMSACVPEEDLGTNTAKSSETAPDNVDLSLDPLPISELKDGLPDHLTVDLENVTIDASISVPDAKTASSYIAKLTEWDKGKLSEVLLGGAALPEVETIEYMGLPYNYYDLDNATLALMPGTLLYNTISSYFYEIPLFNCNTPTAMAEAFPAEDLPALSLDEAVAEVNEALEQLNIDVVDGPTVYTLNKDALNAQQQENLKTADDLFKVTDEDKSRIYTANDEVQIVKYDIGTDNFPVTESDLQKGSSNRYLHGSSVEAYVGADGIKKLDVETSINVLDELETSDIVISPYQAITNVSDKYKQVILDNPLQIKQIRLEMVADPQDNNVAEIRYVPAWFLSPGNDEENYMTFHVVNALNGEIIY